MSGFGKMVDKVGLERFESGLRGLTDEELDALAKMLMRPTLGEIVWSAVKRMFHRGQN